jgi:hypothetical protein
MLHYDYSRLVKFLLDRAGLPGISGYNNFFYITSLVDFQVEVLALTIVAPPSERGGGEVSLPSESSARLTDRVGRHSLND